MSRSTLAGFLAICVFAILSCVVLPFAIISSAGVDQPAIDNGRAEVVDLCGPKYGKLYDRLLSDEDYRGLKVEGNDVIAAIKDVTLRCR